MASSSSSKKCKPHGRGTELIDLVFSWSLKDIFNEELHKYQVQKIPQTFSSVEHYLDSYRYPLVEETHADLLSNMRSVSQWTPSCKILSIEKDESYRPPKDFICKMRLHSKIYSKNHEMYKPQLYDVIAFSDIRPMSAKDLNRPRRSYLPALVVGVWIDGDPTLFRVLVSNRIKFVKGKEEDENDKDSLFAIFLININTNARIWRALMGGGNVNIIKEILHADPSAGFSCDHCNQKAECLLGKDLIDGLHSVSLNESQLDAVLGSMTMSYCKHKSFVKLIWGPPGTGKTKTVGTLLWTLLKKKCKTLTCAPTNIAVIQVTYRLMSLVKETLRPDGYGLGDIVLFGNKERMQIDDHDDLHDIFLKYRVDRLRKCSSQHTGWKHQLNSMICLLEDSVQIYLSYVEGKKLEKEKQLCSQNEIMEGLKDDATCEEVLGFGDFIRKSFYVVEKNLVSCIRCCCIHLPTSFISIQTVDKMNRVLSLLDVLRTSLHDSSFTDEELMKIFSKPYDLNCQASNSSSFILSKSRSHCIEILRSLEEFSLPEFSDMSITKFCLESACLIFCTTSSSAELSEVKTLELLVIDEAAQLKECESAIPLHLPGVRHAILIGDERQLPAMVQSKMESDFGRSLFERLVSLGHPKHLLNIQYRMHPSISLFPNAKFYNKQISDASNVQDRGYRRDLLEGKMYGPYSFIDVSYGKEGSGCGRSQRNIIEVAVVSEIVENLCKASVAKKQKVTVGVVSPYKAQVFALTEKLGQKYESYSDFSVSVRSVDGFQGGEEDVIIYSAVRSNQDGNVGFLSNHQRTNVALTRARYCLWILGNGSTLIKSDSVWKELVLDAKNRECYFSADDDKRLANAIIDSMIELDQLDDLLNMNSLLFKEARWKVMFGDFFCNSMVTIRNIYTRKELVALMVKLSNGWRQTEKPKDLIQMQGNSSELLEQYKIDGLLNLLWTVDICKENSKCIQVLRFWDILPSDKIPEMADHLDGIFRNYTSNNINRCKVKCHEGNLEIPMSWEIGKDDAGLKDINEISYGDLTNQLATLNLEKEFKLRGQSSRTDNQRKFKKNSNFLRKL